MPEFTRPDKVIVIKGGSSRGALLAAGIIGAAVAAGWLGAVIGRIVVAASLAVAVLAVAGLIGLRFAWRSAGGRMSSRAELLSAAQAVRNVRPDPRAIAARARPVRGQLADPAVRLIQVRTTADERKLER